MSGRQNENSFAETVCHSLAYITKQKWTVRLNKRPSQWLKMIPLPTLILTFRLIRAISQDHCWYS